MSLGEKKEPTALELRFFGLMLAAVLGLVGALVLWRWRSPVAAWLLWSLALVVAVVYYALPPLRRPLFLAWRTALLPVEWTISFAALAVAFYLVIMPVGLVMRLLGRDPLQRRFEPRAPSYFVRRPGAGNPARYFRQF